MGLLVSLSSEKLQLDCVLQGTQIEASVWRDLADRYYDLLEEGKASVCPHTVPTLLLILTNMHTLGGTFLREAHCPWGLLLILTDMLILVLTLLAGPRSIKKRCMWSTVIRKKEKRMLQVYYVAKGKVKPANKAYSSVRNDYQLHLDSG